MAGRFEGVSDLEWRLFEDVFPPAPSKRGRGMPHAHVSHYIEYLAVRVDHGLSLV